MTDKGIIKIKNGYLPYATFGRGDRNLVIVPGISVTNISDAAGQLESYFKDFCDEYRLWIIDRRTVLDENCTVAMMAEDTAEAMSALGIQKACIYGASQGGMIAMALAARHPEIPEKLFIASSAARSDDKLKELLESWIRLAESGERRALTEAFASRLYTKESYDKIIDAMLAEAKRWTKEQLKHFAAQCKALFTFDMLEELKTVKCPAFVLGSEGDRVLFPGGSREIADALGCPLFMYGPEYEHAVYDEAPDFLVKLKGFFDTTK